MEIKIGEYVRTKDGIIDRVIIDYKGKCNNETCNQKHISCQCNYYSENKILKHSKRIIDLIEVGDYVNGSKVIDIAKGNIKALYLEQVNSGALIPTIDKDIKTILTHEQFEQNCYRLEEIDG